MKKFILLVFITAQLCVLSFVSTAQYAISKCVFGNGGIEISNGINSISSTIGQTLIGFNTETTKQNYIGFWWTIALKQVGIKQEENGNLANGFTLDQIYPNPFSDHTTIQFTLLQSCFIDMKLYDVLGNEIETIIASNFESGKHSIVWHRINVHDGIYFIQLITSNGMRTKQIIILS